MLCCNIKTRIGFGSAAHQSCMPCTGLGLPLCALRDTVRQGAPLSGLLGQAMSKWAGFLLAFCIAFPGWLKGLTHF